MTLNFTTDKGGGRVAQLTITHNVSRDDLAMALSHQCDDDGNPPSDGFCRDSAESKVAHWLRYHERFHWKRGSCQDTCTLAVAELFPEFLESEPGDA